jgi:tetratricopeptide (TPR) repeat protein
MNSMRSLRWLTIGFALTATVLVSPLLGQAIPLVGPPFQRPQAASNRATSPTWWVLLVAAQDYSPALQMGKLEYCYVDLLKLRNDWLVTAQVPDDHVVFLHDQKGPSSTARPTQQNIRSALARIVRSAGPNDQVLIVLSGHGVHLNGVSYYCPLDAMRAGTPEESNLLPFSEVINTLAMCQARYKLMIVDACRNASNFGGGKGASMTQASEKAPLREDFTSFFRGQLGGAPGSGRTSRGLAVLTSCTAGEESYEFDDLGHGAFTYAFLEGLSGPADAITGNNDGIVSLREAASYASERTGKLVSRRHGRWQTPDLFLGETTLNLPLVVLSGKPASAEDDLNFLVRSGNELSRHADYDPAIDAFTHVIRFQPSNVSAYALRAVAYRAQKKFEAALHDFTRAGREMELIVENREGAQLRDERSQLHTAAMGQKVVVTQAYPGALWVSSVDHDPSRTVRGWIDPKTLGWDPGLVDMYRPVTQLSTYQPGERLERAKEIFDALPYKPPYFGPVLDILNSPTPGLKALERVVPSFSVPGLGSF